MREFLRILEMTALFTFTRWCEQALVSAVWTRPVRKLKPETPISGDALAAYRKEMPEDFGRLWQSACRNSNTSSAHQFDSVLH